MPGWLCTWKSISSRLDDIEKMAQRILRDHSVMALDHEEMMTRNQMLMRRVSYLEHLLRQTSNSHRKSDDIPSAPE